MSQDTAERDETTINEIAGGADEVLAPRAAHRGDRRSLLKVGAAAIAGMMIPAVAGAQVRRKGPDSPEGRTPQPQGSIPRPAGIDPTLNWTRAPLRLARRITMGLNDAEAARATSMGYSQYLEYQLAADVISDTAVDTYVATTFPLLAGDVNTIYNADNGVLQNQISYAGMYRGAFSGRQLKERLVEFWSDHFNIAYSKVGYLKVIDDRDVIRANAMTTFPQLLKASAHSAAMLAYLDQNTSTKTSPNQNYAREIMELHTLGVNGGYTQTDVAELSRVLTGWTLAGRGTFSFNAAIHDYGAKTVIGTVIPAASSATGAAAQQEGETMLNVLAAHPSTATFISTKMLQYFLTSDPTPAQIAEVAAVYSSTGGDIKKMMRTVLSQQNLMSAPAMFKRPYHMIVSSLRALAPNVTVANIAGIAGQINAAGQYPFTWQTPDGFPMQLEYWSGNMLPRWNASSFLSNQNSAASIQFDVTPFMTPATPSAIVSQIDKYIFGGEMTQRLRDELTTYITTTPTSATRVRETIALAMASSPFQYY
jgi:uncharacterized protein (DUF1800 family)